MALSVTTNLASTVAAPGIDDHRKNEVADGCCRKQVCLSYPTRNVDQLWGLILFGLTIEVGNACCVST
jgi:hypothetical protein